jgi:hypothetical protein
MSIQPLNAYTDSDGRSWLRLTNGAKIQLPAGGGGGGGIEGPTGPQGPEGPPGPEGSGGPELADGVATTVGASSASTIGNSTQAAKEDHAHGYATMPTAWRVDSTIVTDLNAGASLYTGFWRISQTGVNLPSTAYASYWHGWTLSYSTAWKQQYAVPFAGAGSYPYGVLFTREMTNGVWSSWYRLVNMHQSYGTLDNINFYQHGSGLGVRRYSDGMFKGGSTDASTTPVATPSAYDAWKVQCYNTSGVYTWDAIRLKEAGVVSHPKGHNVVAAALRTREMSEITADVAATLGVVVEIVQAALTAAGIPVDVRSLVPLAPASDPVANPPQEEESR